ncbi:MAG: fibronectin type III domain-containing protein [Bacteroidia bacterium]|nr:fibronectin type III domain-containing protein [Bacteroidia bacterium]MDW8159240.1 fibronectin type III domain-containing protein [Bacteroidia bacterium]
MRYGYVCLLAFLLFFEAGRHIAQACVVPSKPSINWHKDTLTTDCEGYFQLHIKMGTIVGQGFVLSENSQKMLLFASNGEYLYRGQLLTSSYTVFRIAAFAEDTHCLSEPIEIIIKKKVLPNIQVITPTKVCSTAAPFLLKAQPEGGIFEGPGVIDNFFYPSLVSDGKYTLTYSGSFDSCPYSYNFEMEVQSLPAFELLSNGTVFPDTVCLLSYLPLQASPPGGILLGKGIVSGQELFFSASLAGEGAWEIRYVGEYGACPYAFSRQVVVTRLRQAKIIPAIGTTSLSVCWGGAPFRVIAWPAGGEFEGSAMVGDIFVPSEAGIGKHSIHYVYQDTLEGCTYRSTLVINVHDGSGPVGMKIEAVWGCHAKLIWDNLGEETYQITLRKQGQDTMRQYLTFENTLELRDIEPNFPYEACLYSGCYRSCTTLIFPCPEPTGLQMTFISPTSASLSWQTQPCARYILQYRPVGELVWQTVRAVPPAMIGGLTPNTIYEVRLGAICSNQSPFVYTRSQFWATSPLVADPCLPPSFIEPLLIASGEARFRCQPSAPSSFSCLEVRYGELTIPEEQWVHKKVVNDLVFRIDNLNPGTLYGMRVRSICSECNNSNISSSEWSPIEYFETLPTKQIKFLPREEVKFYVINSVCTKQLIFSLELSTPTLLRLELVDIRGQVQRSTMLSTVAGEHVYEWDVENLNDGMYILRILGATIALQEKIWIVK